MQDDFLLLNGGEECDEFVWLDAYGNVIAEESPIERPAPSVSPILHQPANIPPAKPNAELLKLTPMSKKAKYQQKCRDILEKRRSEKQADLKTCN
jgi:hypothetical protein